MADSNNDLNAMRHSLAHIMATAIQHKWPDAKFGVGPAIENGFYYDIDLSEDSLSEDDFDAIEAEMKKVIAQDLPFENSRKPMDEAIKWAQENNQPYKEELLNDLKRAGTTAAKDLNPEEMGTIASDQSEVEDVSFYSNGDFTDLCRGPHVESTGKVGAFKLNRIAGAYWRGNEKNPQMQRLYGLAFATQEDLDKHLVALEEAKKRDHRILGEKLDLYTISPEVGQGLVLWLPKGTVLKDELEKLGKETEHSYGYQRVSTPHIAKQELYYTSGHLPYYKEDMFPAMVLDNDTYYLKPMNCPHMHMIYKARPHSYKDLPVRYAEFGTVYRNEDSGTLMGMMRVRGLTQNDAHIYTSEEKALDELVAIIEMHKFYYELFGLTQDDYYVELALPDFEKKPDKYFDDQQGWEKAASILREAAKQSGLEVIEKPGEAAFYGPKFDFNIRSATGREFGASTNQLDFGSGERFGLMYTDSDGKDKPVPYIIHRAPLGSDERFIGFLIEHYAGTFPVWMSPEQIRILTVNQEDKTLEFANDLYNKALDKGVRVEVDNANESVGKKIRAAEMAKTPYTIVVGDKEIESGTVTPRIRSDLIVNEAPSIGIDEFIQTVANEAKSRVSKSSM
jgi:threonyl-tRNA synthetase